MILETTESGYLKTSVPNVYIRLVSIHGSIGAGKTTLLEALERKGFRVLYEDIDSWTNFNGHNILEKYYENPPKFAYVFQNEVIRSRFCQIHKLVNDTDWLQRYKRSVDTVYFNEGCIVRVVFCERDHMSSLRVFAKRLLNNNIMTKLEIDQLEHWCKLLGLPENRFMVFLQTPTDVCIARVHLRDRKEERNIVEYDLVNDVNVLYAELFENDKYHNTLFVKPYELQKIHNVCESIIAYSTR